MKKLIIGLLITIPLCSVAQSWTKEEQVILDKVKSGWMAWEEAVNANDLSIYLNKFKPAEDWQAWWGKQGSLWNQEEINKNFDLDVMDVKQFYWQKVNPVSIKVHDDCAFIWFYAYYTIENRAGEITRFEGRRFEVYRKIEGEWRWSAAMGARTKL